MTLKATILFQDSTGSAAGGPQGFAHVGGWSESVLYPGSDSASLQTALFTGLGGLPGLCPSRSLILPGSASIIGVRIATAFPRTGRSQLLKREFPGDVGYLTDVPQMAAQATVPGVGVLNVRRFTLRCLPDYWVQYGELLPGFRITPGVIAYFAALSNFQFAGRDLTQLDFAVRDITAGGVMTLLVNPPWAIGDKINVRNTVDPTGVKFNASRLVAALGPGVNQVTLANWVVGDSTGGIAYRYQVVIPYMDGARAAIDRAVVRKVGRPFEAYRGRRSKRQVR